MHTPPTVVTTVSTRSVNLAIILGIEVDNVHMTTTIVLDDFVIGLECATADNVGCAAAFDRDGVFAYIFEPDEFECAGAFTVDAFALVRADDDVAELCAFFKDEDCVLLTWRYC